MKLRKRLGQHLLRDHAILDAIVAAAELGPGAGVLEIGAGSGVLTRALLATGADVVSVEIDDRFQSTLDALASAQPRLRVIRGDVLDLDPNALLAHLSPPIAVVANLPYQITSPLLGRLLPLGPGRIRQLVLMVQREVADRLAAKPDTPAYGALSIFAQYWTEPAVLFGVPPAAFTPPPKVDSAVVRLIPRLAPPVAANPKALFRVVKAAFGQRRKTLRNALAGLPGAGSHQQVVEALQAAGIDPQRRGETLSLEEFAALAEVIAGWGMVDRPR